MKLKSEWKAVIETSEKLAKKAMSLNIISTEYITHIYLLSGWIISLIIVMLTFLGLGKWRIIISIVYVRTTCGNNFACTCIVKMAVSLGNKYNSIIHASPTNLRGSLPKTNKTHYNTTQKTKMMSNTDPPHPKFRGEPRYKWYIRQPPCKNNKKSCNHYFRSFRH
jgi:hypothetical protein